jgi:hypothetical protein
MLQPGIPAVTMTGDISAITSQKARLKRFAELRHRAGAERFGRKNRSVDGARRFAREFDGTAPPPRNDAFAYQ